MFSSNQMHATTPHDAASSVGYLAPPPPLPQLLTADQVASAYGITVKAVTQAIRAGELVGSKLGKGWRILPADAEAWRLSRTNPSPASEQHESPKPATPLDDIMAAIRTGAT